MKQYTYKDFKSDFDKKMVLFTEAMAAFPWEDKDSYAQWCAHTYYYVCHSTRLLAMGGARTDLDKQSLHRRFIDHLNEEKGHEKLAINDLKRLGYSIDTLPELPETGLFYQNQYYWLTFHGSIPFLGWILALEGGAVHACAKAYERVVKAHGKEAGLFLKVHAEEDIEHLDKALEQVKDLPGPMLQLVAKNLEQSCELYWAILKRIAASKKSGKNSKAA